MNLNSSCIILFIKAPIMGRVKTRLADAVGLVHAVNIYKCFIKDIARTAVKTGFPLKLFYDPPDSKQFIENCLGQKFNCHVQTGSDLGTKMAHALQNVFDEKFARAVLIGSDIPDLPEIYIRNAINGLGAHDAVIGPAADGGYYLIGFQAASFHPEIFKDIYWSTDTVYATTLQRFQKFGLKSDILPQWRDIDTYADLVNLADSLSHLKSAAQETGEYLKQISELKLSGGKLWGP